MVRQYEKGELVQAYGIGAEVTTGELLQGAMSVFKEVDVCISLAEVPVKLLDASLQHKL